FEDIGPFITRPGNQYEICVLVQNLLAIHGIYSPLPVSTLISRVDPLTMAYGCENRFMHFPLHFELLFVRNYDARDIGKCGMNSNDGKGKTSQMKDTLTQKEIDFIRGLLRDLMTIIKDDYLV